MENAPGIRWDVLSQSSGRLSGRSMRESLPHRGDLAVLSWPTDAPAGLQPSAMREVMSAGVRGFGTVVVDLPRHHDPVVEEAVSRCDELIVVVSASVAGVASARRMLAQLPRSTPRHLLVRTRRGGVDPDEISDVLGAPLLATLRDDRGLTEALDLGLGPLRSARGPMATACRAAWLGLRAAVR
jgi:secretion/DNA translocation related CpaE-like protein